MKLSKSTRIIRVLIDDLCHPLFREGEGYIVLDGVLHGLVEQDPPVSVKKFVKYNLPTLLKQLTKKQKKTKSKKAKQEE